MSCGKFNSQQNLPHLRHLLTQKEIRHTIGGFPSDSGMMCAILFEFKDGFDSSESNEIAVFEEFALNLFVIDVEPV